MLCEPEIIDSYLEFDCFDDEGNMETTRVNDYNCQFCNNEECEYWSKYN